MVCGCYLFYSPWSLTMDYPGTEPGGVFHVIAKAGSPNDIVDCFMEHLEEIHAHVKDDITSFCESLGMPVLSLLRKKLFDQLIQLFSLEDFDLVERRKVSPLAEEVYLMGFSVINKMKHSRLTKLVKVKKQKGNNLLETEDKITEKADNGNQDFTYLLAAYLKLTQTVQQKKTINDLVNRVNYLEIKAGQKLEQERLSNDVESAEDNGKPSKSIRQSQESKKNTIQVEA